MIQFSGLFSQTGKIVSDTISVKKEIIITDTISKVTRPVSANAIDARITYNAKGYIKKDLLNKKIYAVDAAEVNYGDINLKADSIVLEMETGLVYAYGRKDSTGAVKGSPVFKDGEDVINVKELIYNFKTEKAIIYNLTTKQEGMILHSTTAKRQADGNLDLSKSKSTTCDAENPHFYISLNKARVYPNDKIISGPAYLVLEDVPLPLILPFGYFPVMKTKTSGIIFPRYGQEQQRGYFLMDGGYYLAISDYFDLKVTGNIYSNGTWTSNTTANYNVRYKYSGSLSFSYANNVNGHKGLTDFQKSINYRLGWSHSTDAKASPGSRFSANVNMSSSGYDRNNSYVVSEHVNTQKQSSVSYTKTWAGTPFNLSASFNQSQNSRNKTVSLNFPKVNFNASQIYPLKRKNSTGTTKWYQDLSFQYSAAIDNQISTYDSLLFTNAVWNKMKNGFKHDAPLSLQLRPFKNFSISPQLTYTGVLYTQEIRKTWQQDYRNRDLNIIVPSLITDTVHGLSYGQAINPSISVGYSPQVFGTFDFKPGSRIQSIRHVMKPSASFSYTPKITGLSSAMYKWVQSDTSGRKTQYSIYEGGIFGTPSLSSRSGGISLSLSNVIEAKVLEKYDTTGKAKKIKIIESFGMSTNYNIFADSMKWSPVSVNLRTVLLENINFSANSSFSMYGLNNKGKAVKNYALIENGKLLRMTNFTMSIDFDLSKLLTSNKSGKGSSTNPQTTTTGQDGMLTGNSSQVNTGLPLDEYGYARFDVPWTLRVAYNFNYSKPFLTPTVSQTMSLSGSVTLTKKINVGYTTGYDFVQKKITMTNVGVTRDLHCWTMSFNWVPTGYLKSWDFTIRVKSSVFQDLKYERRKDFHDTY
jgi:lipopolysaccharide assembly outer membrane protein LptD (OstA)